MSLSMVSTNVSMPYLPIRSISATRSIGAIRTNKDANWLKGPNLIKPSIPLLPLKSEKLMRNDQRSFEVCMSRRSSAEEKKIASDPVYRNRLVTMLVNRLLKHGKKSLAYLIIYDALKRIQQKTEKNPLLILRQAIDGVTPDVTVKSRRVGGSTQQVPVEVGMAQGKALAIRWLLKAARKRPGRSMVFKLSSEILDAARGSGEAIRKREETHKMAEANRAFARFR